MLLVITLPHQCFIYQPYIYLIPTCYRQQAMDNAKRIPDVFVGKVTGAAAAVAAVAPIKEHASWMSCN